ncbi:GlxA family transcriptional regulator [Pseudomonas sp. LRF_L74]|uniref:GlxA family transcriptional regulator n=1 Tax=Pseudomonas sp. LRF_L74 TaxID=3369422 RepID=UPI003F63056B
MVTFAAALDVLVSANSIAATTLFDIRLFGNGDRVTSDLGIRVPARYDLHATHQDVLLVCGGPRVRPYASPHLRECLRAADRAATLLGGLWNGAYFLAEAGLLDGHACAVNPDGMAMIAELYPKVSVTPFAHAFDGKRMSCAGATSSTSMMLELVRNVAGAELASAIDDAQHCDGKHYGGESARIDIDPRLPPPLVTALELMHSNIEEPVPLEDIAAHAGVSRRGLERTFSRHMSAPPMRYYLELRLTHARQLLQYTNKTIREVSVASGFATLSHFCRRFRDFYEMGPNQFRLRSRNALH